VKSLILPVVLILAALGFVAYTLYTSYQESQQRVIMERAAHDVLETGEIRPEHQLDYWGQPQDFKYESFEYFRQVRIDSAGRDGEMGTRDDLTYLKTDKNKAKAFGKYVGQRGKSFLSGIVEGMKEETPFQK